MPRRLAESCLRLGEVQECVLCRFVPSLSRAAQFELLLGRIDAGLHLETVDADEDAHSVSDFDAL